MQDGVRRRRSAEPRGRTEGWQVLVSCKPSLMIFLLIMGPLIEHRQVLASSNHHLRHRPHLHHQSHLCHHQDKIYIVLNGQNPHSRDHPYLYHPKPCPRVKLRDGKCLRLHNHHLCHFFYDFILVTFCLSGKLGAEGDFAHGLRPDCAGPAC